MTAALEVGEWSAARPSRTLSPGKTRYPFYRRLGGPQDRCGRVENLVPTGIRSRTVQPVAQSLYRLRYRPTTTLTTIIIATTTNTTTTTTTTTTATTTTTDTVTTATATTTTTAATTTTTTATAATTITPNGRKIFQILS